MREKYKPWEIGVPHLDKMNGIFEAIGIVHSACTGTADRNADIDEVARWLLWRVRSNIIQVDDPTAPGGSRLGGWVQTDDESEALIRTLARHTLLRYYVHSPVSRDEWFLWSFV